MSDIKVKRCIKCGKSKPVSQFGKHASNDDGYQIWCYTCLAKYQRDQYQGKAEDKKAQVAARRDKIGRLIEKVKARNCCGLCGEDEPACLNLYPIAPSASKITKNSGVSKVRSALNGSAVICLNCRAKVELGLLEPPTQSLTWNEQDLEPPRSEPEQPDAADQPKKIQPALPPGVAQVPGA